MQTQDVHFRSAANASCQMQRRSGWVAAWQNETLERLQVLTEIINQAFQLLDMILMDSTWQRIFTALRQRNAEIGAQF